MTQAGYFCKIFTRIKCLLDLVVYCNSIRLSQFRFTPICPSSPIQSVLVFHCKTLGTRSITDAAVCM